MTDLIIKGAGGIKDGLYVIKDGEMFKHKPTEQLAYTARIYPIIERPSGEWVKATESVWECSLCKGIMFVESNYCPFCGSDMRGEDE